MSTDGSLRSLIKRDRPGIDRTSSNHHDELQSFRSWLRWMCVDQTSRWRAALSWIVFICAAVAVPAVSHFVLSYDDHRRRYDAVVQTSLTAVAALSFLCLSAFLRSYGLRRLLFIDKLCSDSEKVRLGYADELHSSFKLLSVFVLPCFAAEIAYKISWYLTGEGRIPFLGNKLASDAVSCALELFSWLYRTSIFFLVCVLFSLICHLQILRLQDFAATFVDESHVAPILATHLRLRRQLRTISHRFRRFILLSLLLVTMLLLASLLLTTKAHAEVNIFNTGELALSSITIVSGLLLCLRSAARITHKAQAITSHAATWHVCATIESSISDPESPMSSGESSEEETSYDDDEDSEGSLRLHPYINTITYQKRQALVTYLENNKAGITIFGFVVDRSWLHTVFAVELSLVLWLLGKTVGIS